MSEPKKVHDMEQALASFLSIGAGFAKLYQGMVNEGMDKASALKVTMAYARGFNTRSRSEGDG